MKKITLLLLVLLLIAGTSHATDKRVRSLGNNPYMLLGDDASIQLFPQRINDMNLVYFENIHLANPDYLLVIGDPGKTWGFYGGTTQRDDYFNVIRSLGKTAAVRMGLRLGIESQTEILDDKEAIPITSEEKLSQTNIMLDFEYGMDVGDIEFSTYLTFGKTPGNIGTLLGFVPAPHGSFTGDYESGGNSTSTDGQAARTSFALQAKARTNNGLFIFDNSYAVFGLSYQGGASEFTDATNTKIEDDSDSYFFISSEYHMFNNQNLADNKVFLVYGLGGTMYYSQSTVENHLTPGQSVDKFSNFVIVAPTVNLGLETKLKYTTLRFGMRRALQTLGIFSTSATYDAGTNENEDTTSDFVFGGNGSYAYTAGMGFNYGNLQLDILVNNNFWIMGPQMVFDARNGTIGVSADLLYTF